MHNSKLAVALTFFG